MLIDANVFNGYYQTELGKSHILCGCPKQLMQTVNSNNPLFHDNTGIVEHEWSRVVDYEWFEAWLAGRLQDGSIQYLHPQKNAAVEKRLSHSGFPNGRDIVYVRLGLADAAQNGSCYFYTEDMDFYNPPLKSCTSARRLKTLKNSSGPVPKLLKQNGINVVCVP